MFDRTVTVFNFCGRTGRYYPKEFHNCSLTLNFSSSKNSMGVSSGDGTNVVIHTKKDKSYNGWNFVSPLEYEKTTTPETCFTFKAETDFLLIDHKFDSSISLVDDDYESGLYHYMNDNYNDVLLVTSYGFFNLLPHFNVGGR